MKRLFIEKEINYTGEQLRSLWAFREFGLQGDSIVAFIGSCEVKPENMVDLADYKAGARIYSEKMLHFIVEHFDNPSDLEKAIHRQRLLVCLIKDELNKRLGGNLIQRRGDDLYEGDYKVSVSIATLSPVSSLIHLGVNITSRNTPVPAKGLKDYQIEPEEFARVILEEYAEEIEGIKRERCKVRGVK